MYMTIVSRALLILALATTASARDRLVLTDRGLGPVRLGMSVEAAGKALKLRLKVDGGADCAVARRADGRDGEITYMAEKDVITRIDVGRAKTGAGARASVVTAAGVGLGATEAQVRRAYGPRLEVEPHPYDEKGHYLRVEGPGKRSGIIFETSRGRVTSFRAGLYPALDYKEGCL
jgi:hypothetical protein